MNNQICQSVLCARHAFELLFVFFSFVRSAAVGCCAIRRRDYIHAEHMTNKSLYLWTCIQSPRCLRIWCVYWYNLCEHKMNTRNLLLVGYEFIRTMSGCERVHAHMHTDINAVFLSSTYLFIFFQWNFVREKHKCNKIISVFFAVQFWALHVFWHMCEHASNGSLVSMRRNAAAHIIFNSILYMSSFLSVVICAAVRQLKIINLEHHVIRSIYR